MRLHMRRSLCALAAMVLAGASVAAAQTDQRSRRDVPRADLSEVVRRVSHGASDVQINYQSIGSGGGIAQLTAGTVDFGASDMPMTDAQISQAAGEGLCTSPRFWARVVPTYNIPGVTADSEVHARRRWPASILGTITKWNDPKLAKDNPGVKLPQRRYRGGAPLRRQRHDVHLDRLPVQGQPGMEDQSGRAALRCSWPAGLGGKGNEGVAGLVKQTPNSIGYVELIYAVQNKMAYGIGQECGGRRSSKPSLDSRERSGGRRRQSHAGGFPRFHHQRSRQERLSDLQLHLAADSRARSRIRPRRRPSRTSSSGC